MPSPYQTNSPEIGRSLGAHDPRIAATVTLCGMAACLLLAAVGSIEQPGANRERMSRTMPAMTAVGPAPAFCKDQTWPNVDARCLNRVEPPVAAEPAVTNVPPQAPTASVPEVQTAQPTAVAEQSQQPPTADSSMTVEAAPGESLLDAESPPPRPQSRHRYQQWNSPTGRSTW